ncbi:PAS domain-containing protein [Azohydromonas aeria]|uniref:PAS domain-containing protein n=1 Tax=Azohydromonas aeria TaxID=2590212 RepID=UPI0012F9F4EC|nr:PAS domain-containing protein [Azohydromonas aeria]
MRQQRHDHALRAAAPPQQREVVPGSALARRHEAVPDAQRQVRAEKRHQHHVKALAGQQPRPRQARPLQCPTASLRDAACLPGTRCPAVATAAQQPLQPRDADVSARLALTQYACVACHRMAGVVGPTMAPHCPRCASRRKSQAMSERVLLDTDPPVRFGGGAAFVVDRDLRYLVAEGDALRAAGLRPEDLVGRTVGEALPAALAREAEPRYRRALAGEPFEVEHEDFGHRYRTRGVPLRDAAGQVWAVLAVSQDVTAQHEAQALHERLREWARRQDFLLRLNDRLRPLRDPLELQYQASRLLCEHLGADAVHYGELHDTEGGYADVHRDFVRPGRASLAGRYALAAYGDGAAVLRSGRPLVVADMREAAQLGEATRASYRALGIGALLAVPLVREGRLVWVLSVVSDAPRAWTPDEVTLVQEVGDRTWAALERERSEAALRRREAQMHAIVSLVPDLLWRSDAAGRVEWFSERWYAYTGQAPHEALGQGWAQVLHPEDRDETLRAWAESLRTGQPLQHEHRLRAGDGSWRWFLARAQPLREGEGQGPVSAWFGSVTDIHEQRLSRELLEQRVAERTQALRQLLLRVENVQDEERRRIARELHDGLGQALSAVALAVSALRGTTGAGDAAAARERMDRLPGLLHQLDRELDGIVFRLRPTALDDCGLGEGVAAYVQTWGELTGIAVDMELRGLEGARLDAAVEAAVFRVVQEALNNVAKHARATRVSLSLERRRGQLVGSVEDDGVGFDAAQAAAPSAGRSHWGLLGMQERMGALGGRLDIESQPGQGTAVLWRLPLR